MANRKAKITVEELVRRATAGRKFNRHKLFRPSLAYYLVNDPFWLWCEYHAPKAEAVDETTRYEELRMRHGVEHEKRWVAANFTNAVEIKPGFGFEALKNTFRAMLDGLRQLEEDMHVHVHKENSILFPRAVALESAR